MGKEINLLQHYPKTARKTNARAQEKTADVHRIARQFGKEYFDGDRLYGYGGYSYHPRFWERVIPDFVSYYHLSSSSRILDVGCGKGFMLYDVLRLVPGIAVCGVDISSYALATALPEVRPFLQKGSADSLPFPDKIFDLVISINTVHNLPLYECKRAIQELERVGRHAFLTVDAYRNEEEKKRMDAWNLTALTYMSTKEWKKVFAKVDYTGDYYWFFP